MYWNNELTITMNNKKAATTALAVAKNVLTTTSIEEYKMGEFANFADTLHVKKNEVSKSLLVRLVIGACTSKWREMLRK